MTKRQEASTKTYKHLSYVYKQLGREIKKLDATANWKKDALTEENEMVLELKTKFHEVSAILAEMERELPASDNGFAVYCVGFSIQMEWLFKFNKF